MIDFDSEDIDGMDADEGDDQEPAPIGDWKATSSYDIYMADTPKAGDGDEKTEDDPSKKQPNTTRKTATNGASNLAINGASLVRHY